ncbi:hypothetical protein FQR65_LT00744 [Abscondita terminalis]|nr:hypothetical protein FQR65_LT00744 [Abscondita terminalis]
MDTTSNGHNVETWTQRLNELLDKSPKLNISAKFLIGHSAENGHSAEIETNHHRMDTTPKLGHNVETNCWTQRRNLLLDATSNMDTTLKAKTEKPGYLFLDSLYRRLWTLHQRTLDRLRPHCRQVLNGYNADHAHIADY